MKSIFLPFGLKPRKPHDDGPRYADIYERGLAAAIDVLLIFTGLQWLFDPIRRTIYGMDKASMQALFNPNNYGELFYMFLHPLWQLNALVQVFILGAIIIGFQLAWNTTPGKWLFGISIRRNSDLALPERWRYLVRFLAYIPGTLLFFWMSFNRKHRGVHDYIAGTAVIHTRPAGWYWRQMKRGYRKLRGLPAPVEEAVGEPPASERQKDSPESV